MLRIEPVRIVLLSTAALAAAPPGSIKSSSIQAPGPAKVYELWVSTPNAGPVR